MAGPIFVNVLEPDTVSEPVMVVVPITFNDPVILAEPVNGNVDPPTPLKANDAVVA